jgi:molecular chaperone GrpE
MSQDATIDTTDTTIENLEREAGSCATGSEASLQEEDGGSLLRREVEQLNVRLSEALAKNEELKSEVLRAGAETQNVRRRAERDVENAHKYSLERFVSELTAVVDSLDLGIQSIPATDESQKVSREGMILTHRVLVDTLKKFGVTIVDPMNEPFNPQMHQAVATQERTDVAPNVVLNVLQKGFMLAERVIRPAMVLVSKGPESDG